MARGRSSRGQRDAFDITSLDHELLAPISPTPAIRLPSVTDIGVWTEVEDRRRFDPERALRSALSWSGGVASVGERKRPHPIGAFASPVVSYPSFNEPKEAVICARRKSRREVLFAKRMRGGGGRRRRNYQSDVRC